MTTSEFYSLTPREITEEIEARSITIGENRDMENYRTGLICACLVNPHLKKGKKPKTPQDFFKFPFLFKEKEKPKQTSQDHFNICNMLAAAGIGKMEHKNKKE